MTDKGAAIDESAGLEIRGIRKAFQRVVAVDDLSFTVPRAAMFGLLGANGAGKTTTLRMVLNILAPDKGTIHWKGVPVNDVPRNQFGYLPEERGLYPKMKAGEQLVYLCGLYGVSQKEATARAHEWLGRVGLGDAWNRKVEELSKGNQQKVQVLAAILHEPDLMLLDEPFSGLDPINTEVLRDTLLQRREQGHTIVFSSHRLEQVEELCDYVAIIHHGRLLASDLISDLKKQTGRHLVEIAFVPADGRPLDLVPFAQSLQPLGVTVQERRADGLRIDLGSSGSADALLAAAVSRGPGSVRRFEIVEPTLQEIFIDLVQAADPDALEQLEDIDFAGRKVLTEG